MSRFLIPSGSCVGKVECLDPQQEFWKSLVEACEGVGRKGKEKLGLRAVAERLDIHRHDLRFIYHSSHSVRKLDRWKLVRMLKSKAFSKVQKEDLFLKLEEFRPNKGGNAFKHHGKSTESPRTQILRQAHHL